MAQKLILKELKIGWNCVDSQKMDFSTILALSFSLRPQGYFGFDFNNLGKMLQTIYLGIYLGVMLR